MTDEEKLAQEEEQKEILAEQERLKIEEAKKTEDELKNTDWRAEALKHQAIANRLKIKLSKVPAPIINVSKKEEHKEDEELVGRVSKIEQIESKRQFGFEHGLSPQETDIAFKFANGKPTKETLKDPFFEAGLESLRAKERLTKNIPGASSRSSVFQDKSFSELDEKGRKAAFEGKVKAVKG